MCAREARKEVMAVHSDAQRSFDARGELLVSAIVPEPKRAKARMAFAPEFFISRTITAADVVAVGTIKLFDGFGNVTGRSFASPAGMVGLYGDNYKELRRLVESMHRQPSLRNTVSVKFIEDKICDWLKARQLNQATSGMTDYVSSAARAAVKPVEVWIPVTFTSVEEDLPVGRVVLRRMTPDLFALWQERCSGDAENSLDMFLSRMRKKLQGYAAATFTITAEPGRAYELAFEATTQALEFLRCYSPANLSPRVCSFCVPLGLALDPVATHVAVVDGFPRYSEMSIVDYEKHWFIDKDQAAHLRAVGLDRLTEIARAGEPSQFEAVLSEALAVFSRSSLMQTPEDKLVYLLSSLEILLLKDRSEPIQKNIGERMAFVVEREAAARIEFVELFARVYDLRSRFIHHGATLSDIDMLTKFMGKVAMFYWSIIPGSRKVPTKEAFIGAIEREKFS